MSSGSGLDRLAKAKKDLLGDRVVSVVRDLIFNGELRQGEEVQESVLAAKLGVSRGPVRSAMAALAHEGLIRWEPHKSPVVVALTAHDVEEIYSLRRPLELLAATRAARRCTKGDVDRMRAVVNEMRTARQTGDLVALSLCDVQFHSIVYEISAHSRLQSAWNDLRSQVALFLVSRNTMATTDDRLAIEEHEHIAAAIGAHAPDEVVVDLVEGHLIEAFDRLMSSITAADHVAVNPLKDAR